MTVDPSGTATSCCEAYGIQLGALLGCDTEKSAPSVEWGSLRRLLPVSDNWGLDRGAPVDRYYIDKFLTAHRTDIQGSVLEVQNPLCTLRYGSGVERSEIIDIDDNNPLATIVCDLERPASLPAAAFDCFILTQTIHIIFGVATVIANARQALRPGGVLLVSLPCVSRIDPESGLDRDFWRFTPASAKRLFDAEFGAENVEVTGFGNVLACAAFLYGLSVQDLTPRELDDSDPFFPLVACVRARRVD